MFSPVNDLNVPLRYVYLRKTGVSAVSWPRPSVTNRFVGMGVGSRWVPLRVDGVDRSPLRGELDQHGKFPFPFNGPLTPVPPPLLPSLPNPSVVREGSKVVDRLLRWRVAL